MVAKKKTMPKKKKQSGKTLNMSGKAKTQEFFKNMLKPKKINFNKKK